ncbi:Yip1 family protein [Glaciecola petra]|uniref:Yip1 family protein n=1 Tax=Glaciecola petra TaxID=3075602 RepID=A0ABU2ZND9_9ALTE|nr:Yip1 family protein [Aestuariibacter sp. P117]MDT0593931.1 Yip1 family protein [Aestuariibacter sp. P117]
MSDQHDETNNNQNKETETNAYSQPEAELSEKVELSVSNPIQAASEIFYKPKGVFDALAVKDNWSWVPFILLAVVMSLPAYLYFGVVDFEWWRDITINTSMPDASPAEKKNVMSMYQQGSTQLTSMIFSVIAPILINLILALYYTLVTRNDNKSVQGYTDWYGAMWWMSMPVLINSLVALLIIAMHDKGTELSTAVLAPLSVAYLMGIEMSSNWFNFFNGVRLDVIWTIYLSMTCVRSWTNFSANKSLIVAIIPTAFIWLLFAIFAAT